MPSETENDQISLECLRSQQDLVTRDSEPDCKFGPAYLWSFVRNRQLKLFLGVCFGFLSNLCQVTRRRPMKTLRDRDNRQNVQGNEFCTESTRKRHRVGQCLQRRIPKIRRKQERMCCAIVFD